MQLRKPRLRPTLIGGGVLTALAGVTALTAKMVKQRYVTGESVVTQLVDTNDGFLVVLADGKVFWAPEDLRGVMKSYQSDDTKPLSYRIDQFRRNRSGLPVGAVNVED